MTDDTDHRTLAFREEFSFFLFLIHIGAGTSTRLVVFCCAGTRSSDWSRGDLGRRHGFGVRSGSFPLVLFSFLGSYRVYPGPLAFIGMLALFFTWKPSAVRDLSSLAVDGNPEE